MKWGRLGSWVLLVPLMLALTLTTTAKESTIKVGEQTVRISGPYQHENMNVFLLHGKNLNNHDYLTLDEGLEKKLVSVTEKKQEQVSELQIENKSDRPLFLQEGDRLSGGKQDRIVVSSLIIPAKSGKRPLPTFCVEQSRWRVGKNGKAFGNTANPVLAQQAVRLAAKVTPNRGGQGAVWYNVRSLKMRANMTLKSPNSNSSINETLDSKQVVTLCKMASVKLDKPIVKHNDVIGVAIAINGVVEEVNIYPNNKVLKKIYPRLVQSYAVQAALSKPKKETEIKKVNSADVTKFMTVKKVEKKIRNEKIDPTNTLKVEQQADFFNCTTLYKGKTVHLQWLNGKALKEMPKGQNPFRNRYNNPQNQSPQQIPNLPGNFNPSQGGQAGQPNDQPESPEPPSIPPPPPGRRRR